MQFQVVLVHMKIGMSFKVMELTWQVIIATRNYGRYHGYLVYAHIAILYTKQDPKNCISTWFSKSNYMATHQSNILLLNGSNLWVVTNYTKPLPLTSRRIPVRPSVKIRRHVSKHEGKYPQVSSNGRTIQCKNFLERGHIKAFCKNSKVVQNQNPKRKWAGPVWIMI